MSSRSSTLLYGSGDHHQGEGCFRLFASGKPGEDWTLCVHPQGWVYFCNTTSRAVTDHDIRAPGLLEHVESIASKYSPEEVSEGMEVHIHIPRREASTGAGSFNLLVNHTSCLASYVKEEVEHGRVHLLEPEKLNRCRRLYWNYLWNHPVHVALPSRALEDASDALLWFYTDNLISSSNSVVPFSKAECDELSRVIRDLNLPPYERSISKTVFVAWFLREVCSFRDAESWGQYTLKESKELRETRRRTTRAPQMYHPSPVSLALIHFVINFLFFGIPHTYLTHVKASSQYQGRLVSMQQNWEKYIERLVRDHSNFLLIATVLLSATVGFLAVPDIPEGASVAATVSALTSLGSIIIGVFSIWRHQANTSATDSFTYMHNVRHSLLGLYGHSLLLSLPPALLVWAVISFSVSIIVFVTQNIYTHGAWTQISAWILLGFFILLFSAVSLALYTFSIIWKFQRPRPWIWNRLWTFVRHRSRQGQAAA